MANTPPHTSDQLKQADEKIGIIQILTGRTAGGEDFYAYVSVRPSMYEEFCRKVEAREKMNVEEFGKILHKGYGNQPSDDVKHYMEERYGIDPDFSNKWDEAIRQFKLKHQQGKT